MKKWIVLSAAVCCAGALPAQYTPHPAMATEFGFVSPVAFSMLLSANYGELRGNHFHSGIDIKTQGVINKPIRAIADGTVVRIAVSPSGFGKALYINHPNGTTSVYGHLERFSDSIERYIHEIQYVRKSFAVDVKPPAGKFVFKQGEQIALSGNRGSSGGPHLHLEVRETDSQRPLNLLARGMLQVRDTIPPKPVVLYYIGVDTVQGVPVHTVRWKLSVRRDARGNYTLLDTAALRVARNGYFAVEAEEKKNGTDNPMGVYAFDVTYDGKPAFSMVVDRIGFDVGRYCYAAALYPQSRATRNGVYRLYKLPNNRLPVYRKTVRNGLLTLDDDGRHEVGIELTDDCGNASRLAFRVVRGLSAPQVVPDGIPVDWTKDFRHQQGGLSLSVPRGALYESILLDLSEKPKQRYAYSPLYAIHTPDVPLQGAVTVSIDASELPAELRSKALLATVGRDGGRSAAGGAWKEGRVTTETRSFGTYYIAVDTVAPRITPQFKSGDDFASRKTLSFKISDDFSGIGSYSAAIDGKWALFEYDPKTATLTHYFDDGRWSRETTHVLVLTVADGKGNKTVFRGNYRR